MNAVLFSTVITFIMPSNTCTKGSGREGRRRTGARTGAKMREEGKEMREAGKETSSRRHEASSRREDVVKTS